MADRKPTPREIEREVEQERAELRDTVEELMGRFSFDEAWTRAGAYLRDNRSDLRQSLGRAVKDKPLAVALTAVGLAWLLFGPAQAPDRTRQGRSHDATRRRLETAGFAAPRARGPARAHATTDPWTAPARSPVAAPRGATPVPPAPATPGQGRGDPLTLTSPAPGTGVSGGETALSASGPTPPPPAHAKPA